MKFIRLCWLVNQGKTAMNLITIHERMFLFCSPFITYIYMSLITLLSLYLLSHSIKVSCSCWGSGEIILPVYILKDRSKFQVSFSFLFFFLFFFIFLNINQQVILPLSCFTLLEVLSINQIPPVLDFFRNQGLLLP